MDPHAKMERDAIKHVKNLEQTLGREPPKGYFQGEAEASTATKLFDTLHPKSHDFSPRRHRDDRNATAGIDVHAEEMSRTVPVKSNSVYGARPPLEKPTGEHARRPIVKQQFYAVNGVRLE